MPLRIELAGREFDVKSEFHVTLLGREILLHAGLIDMPALAHAIRHAARGVSLDVQLIDDLRLVSEDEAATIIQMCSVTGSEEFFQRFAGHTGRTIARPPYHVTLYTSGTRKGISLRSEAELQRLGRPLAPDERRIFLRSIR